MIGWIRLSAILATGVGAGLLVTAVRHPVVNPAAASSANLIPPELSAPAAAPPADSAVEGTEALIERLVARTPFRAGRRAAAVAYDPTLPPGAEPPSPRAAEPPPFVVTGIVWGREPAAVLEGVPGSDVPRIVHRGDTLAGVRIARVYRDRIVAASPDTTWSIPVRVTW